MPDEKENGTLRLLRDDVVDRLPPEVALWLLVVEQTHDEHSARLLAEAGQDPLSRTAFRGGDQVGADQRKDRKPVPEVEAQDVGPEGEIIDLRRLDLLLAKVLEEDPAIGRVARPVHPAEATVVDAVPDQSIARPAGMESRVLGDERLQPLSGAVAKPGQHNDRGRMLLDQRLELGIVDAAEGQLGEDEEGRPLRRIDMHSGARIGAALPLPPRQEPTREPERLGMGDVPLQVLDPHLLLRLSRADPQRAFLQPLAGSGDFIHSALHSCRHSTVASPAAFPTQSHSGSTRGGRVIRRAKLSWAKLIHCAYEVDPLRCPFGGAELKILAFVLDFGATRTLRKSLGLSAQEPWSLAHVPPNAV